MDFSILRKELKGDLFTDNLQRILYATDGSAYREIPAAVARPKDKEDIKKIIDFARINSISIIPRGAGTSLAGQVVGPGIVIDVSKYMNRIIEFNPAEKWVKVEPGVILGELNQFLSQYGLLFGPETSTANRCCMGGMLGNNSCGLHSIVFGSVRDHILEAEVILSDGSEVTFRELTNEEFSLKYNSGRKDLETRIYRNIFDTLSVKSNRDQIRNNYPDPRIRRRNNGYALDILLETEPFTGNGEKINICKLLAGSEGTLAFSTSLKLNLINLPDKKSGLLCAHFEGMQEALKANIIALRHKPDAIELIDDFIINCTRENIEQQKNRFFIQGDPRIILIIEFSDNSMHGLETKATDLVSELKASGYGYHYPFYTEMGEINRIWDLRKAGLGVLLNIPGKKRSVQVIEDTAVLPEYYPDYMAEFEKILQENDLTCSYYGHIATGELHFSPLLDLRNPDDVKKYYNLAKNVSALVKKYRGSLSGEHGDGRLRGEFIPFMLGDHIYHLLKELKRTWDPDGIFNPGKITDTPSLVESLRYMVGIEPVRINTVFRMDGQEGFLNAVEKCSGSGDCRKSTLMGGTMCPSFMVTGDEDKSTRGRANILREFLTRSAKENPFDHEEIYQVMDLCLSCKACKSECPSNVDMAFFKAEFLQHYYESHHIPIRTLLIAWLPRLNLIGKSLRPVTNFLTGTRTFMRLIGFTINRRIPLLSKVTLRSWFRHHSKSRDITNNNGQVYLFADEFTDFNESDIGIKAVMLLEKLGYEVMIPQHRESGRTFLSKGLLNNAKKIANLNVKLLKDLISDTTPLIGIEPSAILTFRDEYPELVDNHLREAASDIGKNTLLFEEFICKELDRGVINDKQFTISFSHILLHGHCQQKAIASTAPTIRMLSIPVNYKVEEIQDGCCGMAGSFGYEKEHYELSMKIGELILFPVVREANPETIITAPGTSCRHHIVDGTGRQAFHPIEVLYNALI